MRAGKTCVGHLLTAGCPGYRWALLQSWLSQRHPQRSGRYSHIGRNTSAITY